MSISKATMESALVVCRIVAANLAGSVDRRIERDQCEYWQRNKECRGTLEYMLKLAVAS